MNVYTVGTIPIFGWILGFNPMKPPPEPHSNPNPFSTTCLWRCFLFSPPGGQQHHYQQLQEEYLCCAGNLQQHPGGCFLISPRGDQQHHYQQHFQQQQHQQQQGYLDFISFRRQGKNKQQKRIISVSIYKVHFSVAAQK